MAYEAKELVFEERAVAWASWVRPDAVETMRESAEVQDVAVADVLECLGDAAAFEGHPVLRREDDMMWRCALQLLATDGYADFVQDERVLQLANRTYEAELKHRAEGLGEEDGIEERREAALEWVREHRPDADNPELLLHCALSAVQAFGAYSRWYTGVPYGVGVYRCLLDGRLVHSCEPNGALLTNGPRLRMYAMETVAEGAQLTFARLTNLDVEPRRLRQERLRATDPWQRECTCSRCARGSDADGEEGQEEEEEEEEWDARRREFDLAAQDVRGVQERFLEAGRLVAQNRKSLPDVMERGAEVMQLSGELWESVVPLYKQYGQRADLRSVARIVYKLTMKAAGAYAGQAAQWAMEFLERYYAHTIGCMQDYMSTLAPLSGCTYHLLVEYAFDMVRLCNDGILVVVAYYRQRPELFDAISQVYSVPPADCRGEEMRAAWYQQNYERLLKQFKVDPLQLRAAPGETEAQREAAYFNENALDLTAFRRAREHAMMFAAMEKNLGQAALVLGGIARSVKDLGTFSLAPNAILDAAYVSVVQSIAQQQQE